MTDQLSVVIPTRDTRELVGRAVASVLREAPGAEIVVVDDGSADGTEPALRSTYPSLTILRQERSIGYSRAVNLGLARTRRDPLLLLNSDTEIEPGAIAALAAAFDAAPRLGVIGAQLYYPDGRRQWSGGREPSLPWLFALASGWGPALGRLRAALRPAPPGDREPRRCDWVSGAAMALRRAVYREIGPLDESYVFYAQDLDYCRRAAAQGWEVAVAPAFRVVHVHGATVAPATGQRLDLLWSDLARWMERAQGPRRGTAARRALALGSLLRPRDRAAGRRGRAALRSKLGPSS